MVSTPEGCNDNSTMTPNQYESMENSSARKSFRQFQQHWMLNIGLVFIG